MNLLDSLRDYRLIAKDQSFSYVHNSGCLSDMIIRFVPHLLHLRQCTSTKISRTLIRLSFRLEQIVQSRQIPLPLNGFSGVNGKNANMSLYISTLAILLGSLRVAFHLLRRSVHSTKSNYALNQYHNQIVWCLKRAKEVAIPQERVRRSTRKPKWSFDPNLKIVKNKAKLWLRIWIDNG